MLNHTVLTGNLGADPEVFYSSEGNPVASFSLAFRSLKKKTGWIKVAHKIFYDDTDSSVSLVA
jgi:single-strand DNA-binding protein